MGRELDPGGCSLVRLGIDCWSTCTGDAYLDSKANLLGDFSPREERPVISYVSINDR
jgi:hypothetical protein